MVLMSSRDLILGGKQVKADAWYYELWGGACIWEGGDRGAAVG